MWSDECHMSHNGDNVWKSASAAARHIGVSLGKLYKLVNDGELVAYKPSRSLRFLVEDLDDYLERKKVQPGDLDHLVQPRPRRSSD